MNDRRRRTLGMVILSQLGVVMFVLKMAMASLPNIEPVSLLVMVYAVTLGPWALVQYVQTLRSLKNSSRSDRGMPGSLHTDQCSHPGSGS